MPGGRSMRGANIDRRATAEGVFQPEEPGFVTGPSHPQHVIEGGIGPGRVEHEVHAIADRAHGQDRRDLALNRSIEPADGS